MLAIQLESLDDGDRKYISTAIFVLRRSDNEKILGYRSLEESQSTLIALEIIARTNPAKLIYKVL